MESIFEKLSSLKLKHGIGHSLRAKALKGLAAFLGFMVAFTVLSRAADSLTIAMVSTESAQKRTIDRTIKSNGLFGQSREEAVVIPQGILIQTVSAVKGSNVQAGDVLMELDLADLKEQILEMEHSLKELQLTNQAKEENNKIASNTKQKELEQAKEEYSRAAESGNKTVTKAYEAMMEAYQSWQDFKNSRSDGASDESQVAEALKNAYNQKAEDVKKAEKELSGLQKEMEQAVAEAQDKEQEQSEKPLGNSKLKQSKEKVEKEYASRIKEAEAAVLQAEKEQDAAKNAYEQYMAEQGKKTEESLDEQEAALEKMYDEKKDAYDNAVDMMDETLYAKEKAVENAVKEPESDYSGEINQMKMEEMERKLSKLKALEEAGGVIKAPIDGVVTDIAVSTGDFTPSAKSFLIADLGGGFKFTAQIDEEQKKYVSVGDTAVLNLSGQKKMENLIVEAMVPNTEDASQTDVLLTVDLDTAYFSEIYIGCPAEMEIERKSEAYKVTVPLEALHEENGQKYLLVLKETSTILGNQLSVERLDVTVLEKNSNYAALAEGALANGQKFVTDSNKVIEAGDRVRLTDE